MSERTIRLTTSEGEGDPAHPSHTRLHQIIGFVSGKLQGTQVPLPFGREIAHLHDRNGTLVVHFDSAESMLRYGQLFVDAWRVYGELNLELSLPDGTVIKVASGFEETPLRSGHTSLVRPIR